jgi:hypothetical protein
VFVTAPSVMQSMSALDVAAVADAVVLVDSVASARRAEATRVVAELRAAGCRVSGCVLTGVGRTRLGDAAQPAARVDPRDYNGAHQQPNRRFRQVTFTNLDDRTRAENARSNAANGSSTT